MPQSIPKGLTHDHVLKAIADLDAGIEHPFGKPTGYEVVHADKRYAPKAVVGVAFRHVTGQILQPSKFSGGEATGQANYVLRRLGFSVAVKENKSAVDDSQAGNLRAVQFIVVGGGELDKRLVWTDREISADPLRQSPLTVLRE